LNQILIGSEGTFGVLLNATLKVRSHMPENRKYFSYMFKTWDDGLEAVREIMQSECGLPSVFRVSDAEETDVGMKLYGIEGTPADSVLNLLGYRPMERCLLLGTADGERAYCKNIRNKVRQIARHHGGFNLTPFGATQRWEHSRFSDPYMREDLLDFGIMIDTLECSVTWSQLKSVHKQVRDFIKSRPNTICMVHCSHFYPQGTNLYFIFIAKMDSMHAYLDLQYGILEAIQKSGAAMSHHHGIGKQTAPWFKKQIGEARFNILRSLKQHFDPNYIMNPGGTLGFDMTESQENKIWGIDR
jgi:alkyldihydroxyacetonephosphate synthase